MVGGEGEVGGAVFLRDVASVAVTFQLFPSTFKHRPPGTGGKAHLLVVTDHERRLPGNRTVSANGQKRRVTDGRQITIRSTSSRLSSSRRRSFVVALSNLSRDRRKRAPLSAGLRVPLLLVVDAAAGGGGYSGEIKVRSAADD
jgi:hypothetical protein